MTEDMPNLSFVVPGASENRWTDLLASLLATDPRPISHLLGLEFDGIQREVVVCTGTGRGSDRLDLLLTKDGSPVAAIEAKLLSDLGPSQLQRYEKAFPTAAIRRVLHLRGLPVDLHSASRWRSLTWEDVLGAYASSPHPWVATTATAWLSQLDSLVPKVDSATVWNDVPDDLPGMELALRARIAWLSGRLDAWCGMSHDMVQASGGGNWAVRLWSPATSTQDHLVTAEFQEGLSAYFWKPTEIPYHQRLKGPVVLVGLRQDGVTTSADFNWSLLRQMFTDHVLDVEGDPQWSWQSSNASPKNAVDKANWQAMVAAGAPKWLGKGWGMKVAQDLGSCLFGARIQLKATHTLGELEETLRAIETMVHSMAQSQAI